MGKKVAGGADLAFAQSLGIFPGLVLCIAIAIVAYALGHALPVVGGPVFGIIFGMMIALPRTPDERFQPGIKFASKQLLQLSIILLGANLQLGEVVGGGLHALPVMLGTAVITLTGAYIFGKMLGIDRDLRRLLGVGTTICGGSAIAALSSVIDVSETEVAYAISTVFLFNIAAVLTFPWIGHLIDLSQHAFGLWAGTAINDTSSVVAAGYVYGHAAGNEAVIVKLTRTTLIIPLVLFYAGKRIWRARASGQGVDWNKIVPWFIGWFILAAVINTFGLIPGPIHPAITEFALFLIVVALAGVGLSANAQAIRSAGVRPLALGFLLWALIALSSLAIARAAHLD
jgi:uncharacterized integral membrane protein (TIGR00698 family)